MGGQRLVDPNRLAEYRQRAGKVAERYLGLADLVIADGEVVLPVEVGGVFRRHGERDRLAVFVRFERACEVALGGQRFAEPFLLTEKSRCSVVSSGFSRASASATTLAASKAAAAPIKILLFEQHVADMALRDGQPVASLDALGIAIR